METLTKEQIEQKKQQLAEKWEECKALLDELKSAGVTELSDEDLKEVTGGLPSLTETGRLKALLETPKSQLSPEQLKERELIEKTRSLIEECLAKGGFY